MATWIAIGSGGFLGAIMRYAIYVSLPRRPFPAGILAANLIGCFLMGAVIALVQERGFFSERTRHFVMVGILGALTTYSSFAYDTVDLARTGAWGQAALNIGASVGGGIVAVLAGFAAARAF